MSTNDGNICERCQAIDFERFMDMDHESFPISTDPPLQVVDLDKQFSVHEDNPCSLCKLFCSIAPCKDGSECSTWSLVAKSYLRSSGIFDTGIDHRADLPAFLKELDKPLFGLICACSNDSCHKPIFQPSIICSPKLGHPRDAPFNNRSVPSSVNYGTLSKWLDDCKVRHGETCRSKGPRPKDLKLIDCETLKIVPAASSSTSYVAVSYVWGHAHNGLEPIVKTDESSHLEVAHLPRVIADAIEVTKGFGMRYLWCDKYCIDQECPDDKTFHINQMDSIYEAAEICLVAAAGNGENIGLPGVGASLRKRNSVVSLRGLNLLRTPPHPHSSISISTWSTRGWTYQEGILPRRRLVFTQDQVYFECEGKYVFESFQHTLASELMNPGHFSAKIGDNPLITTSWDTYLAHIERYTKRTLSYEEDSIRAFTGIIKHITRDTAIHHFWGIPYMVSDPDANQRSKWLLKGLLWRPVGAAYEKPIRRASFPSWSWAGWSSRAFTDLASDMFNFERLTGAISLEYAHSCLVHLDRADGSLDEYPQALCFEAWIIPPDKIGCCREYRFPSRYQCEASIASENIYFDLSIDPDIHGGRARLEGLLESRKWEIVVLGVTQDQSQWANGSKEQLALMVIERSAESVSRVGLAEMAPLSVSFEEFQSQAGLEWRHLRLV